MQSLKVIGLKSWQHSKECMRRLRNIAMCDYEESVTTGQTDAGQSDPYVPLCFAGNTNSGSIPRNACVACETAV